MLVFFTLRRVSPETALLTVEALGTLLLWAPLPFAWIWAGGRVYALTGSLFLDGAVALLGFAASAWLAMHVLARLDEAWIARRRRAGYPSPAAC